MAGAISSASCQILRRCGVRPQAAHDGKAAPVVYKLPAVVPPQLIDQLYILIRADLPHQCGQMRLLRQCQFAGHRAVEGRRNDEVSVLQPPQQLRVLFR